VPFSGGAPALLGPLNVQESGLLAFRRPRTAHNDSDPRMDSAPAPPVIPEPRGAAEAGRSLAAEAAEGLWLADVDAAANETLSLAIAVAHGAATARGAEAAALALGEPPLSVEALEGSGEGDSTLRLNGTARALNAALARLAFAPARRWNSFAGGAFASLRLAATDSHGAVGRLALLVRVVPVNDPPVIVLPGATVVDAGGGATRIAAVAPFAVREDTRTALLGVDIDDPDVDEDPRGVLAVRLSVGAGELDLPEVDGLAFEGGAAEGDGADGAAAAAPLDVAALPPF
jgi:hypothetical protein